MPNTGDIVKASDFQAIKPQLSIGTVTTGAAGTNASASISGTSPNFKLNLTIPRGNTGATGATDPQGPSGTYTGPLKPTSNYWKVIPIASNGFLILPSGGTWAYVTLDSNNSKFMKNYSGIGVAAGGTNLSPIDGNRCSGFCWRIQ